MKIDQSINDERKALNDIGCEIKELRKSLADRDLSFKIKMQSTLQMQNEALAGKYVKLNNGSVGVIEPSNQLDKIKIKIFRLTSNRKIECKYIKYPYGELCDLTEFEPEKFELYIGKMMLDTFLDWKAGADFDEG